MWRAALVFAASIGLSACGLVFPYESSGSCPPMAHGVCASVREVYHDTQSDDPHWRGDAAPPQDAAAPVQTQATYQAGGRATAAAASAPASLAAAAAISPVAPAVAEDHGPTNVIPVALGGDATLPLRTPASVMRIWIAPWVTPDDDLVLSGYVFTEVRPRTWEIGGQSVVGGSQLRPVEYDQVMAPTVTGPRVGAGQPHPITPVTAGTGGVSEPRMPAGPAPSPIRPVVHNSAGVQPSAPEGGFWQTSPGGSPMP
jgi:conjugal transfer pilus assembly protein TraV